MPSVRIPILALSMALLSPSIFAEPTYSWQECVALATEKNSRLEAARASARASEYARRGTYSNLLPEIYGTLGYGRTSVSGGRDGYSASLNATQEIFTGLSDLAVIRRAKTNERIAEIDVRTAKAQVSFDLKSAFEGLSFAKSYVALADEIIRRRRENLRLVELRFQTGSENRGSVLLSQAYLDQAAYDVLQAKHLVRTASAALARAIGIDEFQDLQIVGEIPISEPPAQSPPLTEIARDTPALLRARASEEVAEAGITIARSGFFPSLGLTATHRREDEAFFPGRTETWSLSAGITIPLFNGGRDYYGVKSAAQAWRSSVNAADDVRREVLTTLERAYATYLESVARLKADESFRTASQVRAEIGRRKYNNGLLTFENWDIIENDLISRQKAYLQSKRDRVIAEAAWENAQGKGVIP